VKFQINKNFSEKHVQNRLTVDDANSKIAN